MIRFIGVVLFLILFLILGLPALGLEWLISKVSKRTCDYQCLRIVQWAFRVILSIADVDVTVIGEEKIPEGAVLFIGNHRSYFDILVTYSRCKNLTGYIAKKEMLQYPILRVWMKRLYCLFLDRENMKEGLKTILQAIDYVKQGISICIFPEGTRNKGEEGSLLPFHQGSFKIAEKSGCPIVPMSLNNTVEIFEAHFPRMKKTHVILEYGNPIYPNELTREEKKNLASTCQNIIKETLAKNQPLV